MPTIFQETKLDLKKNKISWIPLRYVKQVPLISKPWGISQGILKLMLSSSSYDVIICRSYIAAIIGCVICKLKKIKFVFDMRGFWPEERVDGALWSKNGIYFKLFKCIEKFLLKNTDCVIVLTKNAQKFLMSNMPYLNTSKIKIIPTCVDTQLFRSKLKTKNTMSFCYSGSIGTWYGLYEMLSFFSCVQKYYPTATLDFLINHTAMQNLSSDILTLISSQKNIQIQTVSYKMLPNYLEKYTFGLFFYKRPLSKAGCCPTKLGEYFAMGIPVITNRGTGDCDEWIETNHLGILIDDFSKSAYERGSAQIPSILNDVDIREKCRKFSTTYLDLYKVGIPTYQNIIQQTTKQNVL